MDCMLRGGLAAYLCTSRAVSECAIESKSLDLTM